MANQGQNNERNVAPLRLDSLVNTSNSLASLFDTAQLGLRIFKAIRNANDDIEDFQVEYINQRTREAFGDISRVGTRLSDYGSDGIEQLRYFIDVIESGKKNTYTRRVKSGVTHRWLLFSNSLLADDRVLQVWEEITEIEKTDFESRENTELLQKKLRIEAEAGNAALQNLKRIIDTTHESVISLDMKGQITYWSAGSERIYGYKSEEVVGKSLKSFLVPDDRLQERDEFSKTIYQEGSYVKDVITKRKTKDGRILTVMLNVFALKDENGNIIGSCGIGRDVTQQRHDEEEIRKQHDILKQAEAIGGMGSWEYNTATKEFLWSNGMYALFGIRKGKPVKPCVYIDKVVADQKSTARKIVDAIEQNYEPLETTIDINFHGKRKTIKIKVTPLKNDKGEVERMLGINMDITDIKRSEQKIADLNNTLLAANNELSSVNSELRNFSNIALNNYSDTLRHLYIVLELIVNNDARNLSNSGRANLRRAQSSIQKMKLLTGDINKYLHLYELGTNKSMIDPNTVVANVLESISGKVSEIGATVERSQLPAVWADPFQFSVLMTNLLENAIKFRKLVVPLVIRIYHSRADELNAFPKALRDTPYDIISVSDNGIGFPDEDGEKIFELFTRLNDNDEKNKYKGSGIGLTICRKIMEMHGAFITAEGTPGVGATFRCYFPVSSGYLGVHTPANNQE